MIWLLISLCLSFLSSLILINRAHHWGLVDMPEERKVHVVPTPRTGGIAMVIGGIATLVIYLASGHPWPALPWQTLLAGCGFLTLGGLDDRFGFHPRKKFLWFALFALLAAWPWAFDGPPGFPYTIILGPWTLQAPRWLAYPFLALWFLAVPNIVNIEDAINGYIGGLALILLSVAAVHGVNVVIPLGALAGFLALNWPKAKHFLGDAGSFGCGFVLAEALLRAGGNQRPLLALVLTAPLSMDVCMGIIRRIRLKMSLFDTDRSTCPHHVVNLCHQSHTAASLLLWANAAAIAFLAFQPAAFEVVYLTLFASVLVFLNRAPLFRPSAPLDRGNSGNATC